MEGTNLQEPTLFDDVAERNVTFLIDTSGSMYSRLAIVKQHLKEYLKKMAFRGNLTNMSFRAYFIVKYVDTNVDQLLTS